MLIVPKEPKKLRLSIGRLWNGERCPDSRLSAVVEIQSTDLGIVIEAIGNFLTEYSNQKNENQNKAENLNSADRLEIFFVEEGGEYLEIILTPSGQHSVIGYESPEVEATRFDDINFLTDFKKLNNQIKNSIVIPWECFPSNLSSINAFLIVGSQTLAYHPVGGSVVNIHQPKDFPFVRLEQK